MRKQGIWVMRFVMLTLFLFVVSFMGYHIWNALYDPFVSADAVLQEIEDVIPVSGLFVREEVLLPKPDGVAEQALGEGERVGRGQTVAYIYPSSEALQESARAQELERRLEQLTYVQEHGGALYDAQALDERVTQSLVDTLDKAGHGLFSTLDTFELKSSIFYREFSHREDVDFSAGIAGLTAELAALRADAAAVRSVQAEQPGAFSSAVDGFEAILTPAILPDLLPSGYDELLAQSGDEPDPNLLGKLITGFTWYYAAVMDTEDARQLSGGEHEGGVTLRFVGDRPRTLTMRVQSVGPDEDGRCMVIFYTQQHVSDFVDMRHATADLIHQTYKGIRVPREAVRLAGENGDEVGVYTLIIRNAVWKPVNIIYEGESFYLVEFVVGNRDAVMPGDEIIVSARDLYDGKVLRQ
jgi:hypothetical protein